MTDSRQANSTLTGPFDHPEAAGMLQDIASGEFPIDDLLDELLAESRHSYLPADHGAMIVALAHLSKAVADGDDFDELKLPVSVNPNRFSRLGTPGIVEALRQGLEAVLSDATVSGLYAHWQGQGQELLHEWKAVSHVDLSPR